MDSLYAKFDKLESYLTGKGNFRHEVATIQPYKGNRKPDSRPVYYKEIREYLQEKYKATVVDGEEADDALGRRQTDGSKDTCIISVDKDLLQIPGEHFNWVKNERKTIDERTGNRNFYVQLLTGDAVDHIKGIDGIGPVKAGRIIEQYSKARAMWSAARIEWHKNYPDGVAGMPVGEAITEVAKLLWIARTDCPRWKEPE